MDWLNLHTSKLDSPEVVGAEPIDRGTWLMLLRYCIGQENGGMIAGCHAWKDRKWQQLCRVTLAEVRRESDLWAWLGEDLRVTHYPSEKEEIVKTKRQIARENGTKGGRPLKPMEKPTGKPISEPILVISGKAEGKGSRREVEGEGNSARKRADEVSLPDIVSLYPRREKAAEAIEALAAHVAKGADIDSVASGTRAIAAVIARLPGGHLNAFVPSAAQFFRHRRWEDDPQTWLRNAAKHTNGAPQQTLDLGGRRAASHTIIG